MRGRVRQSEAGKLQGTGRQKDRERKTEQAERQREPEREVKKARERQRKAEVLASLVTIRYNKLE